MSKDKDTYQAKWDTHEVKAVDVTQGVNEATIPRVPVDGLPVPCTVGIGRSPMVPVVGLPDPCTRAFGCAPVAGLPGPGSRDHVASVDDGDLVCAPVAGFPGPGSRGHVTSVEDGDVGTIAQAPVVGLPDPCARGQALLQVASGKGWASL